MKKRGHSSRSPKPNKKILSGFKWFFVWALIYFIFYLIFDFLLRELFGNSNFLNIPLIYFLIMGLLFSIFSRVVWCLIHQRRISLGIDVFFYWTFAFAFSIWFGSFLSDLSVEKLGYGFLYYGLINILIISFVVTLLIKLIKKIEFDFGGRKMKAPQQIVTGILLIIGGILTFRFSYEIFVGWFNWDEGMVWSWLLGSGLIVGGFLTLVAWWRNNVSMFTTKHHVRFN